MKISEIAIFKYVLGLNTTLKINDQKVNTRSGFILRITDDNEHTGYGEISPLPGLDSCSIEECLQQLRQFSDKADKNYLPVTECHIDQPFLGLTTIVPIYNFNPLVLFGIESALLGICLAHKNENLIRAFKIPDDYYKVNLNGLFFPDKNEAKAFEQISFLKQAGFKTIKIKIGRHNPAFEIKQIRQLIDSYNGNIILRLDGNRGLDPDKYRYYYTSLKDMNMEYVEEPLPDMNHDFVSETGGVKWHTAIDESLGSYLDPDKPDFESLPKNTSTLVLKPGSCNGISGMIRLIKTAELNNIKCVLSSSFNTNLTTGILGLISRTTDSGISAAHGLDTGKFFTENISEYRFIPLNGRIKIPLKFFYEKFPVNYKLLERIS